MRDREVDLDCRLEIDFDDAIARQRLQLDVLYVIDLRGQRALVIINDASGHIVRRQAVVSPHHADDGNADVWKNVGRGLDPCLDAKNKDQNRHDDEGVRSLQGNAHDGEHDVVDLPSMQLAPKNEAVLNCAGD